MERAIEIEESEKPEDLCLVRGAEIDSAGAGLITSGSLALILNGYPKEKKVPIPELFLQVVVSGFESRIQRLLVRILNQGD